MQLTVKNLLWNRLDRYVLDNVSFELGPGEVCGFFDSDKESKIALLRALTGSCCFDGGEILCEELSLVTHPEYGPRYLGYVPAELPDSRYLKAWESLDFDLRAAGLRGDARRERQRWLEEFLCLEKWRKKSIYRLAPAVKRRLMLAGVLAKDPPFLLLDDPLAGADAEESNIMLQAIRTLAGSGKGVLLFANSGSPALTVCDRVLAGPKVRLELYNNRQKNADSGRV